MTYHCTWADVELLEMPDGTMVADDHGDLVAHVDEGQVVALVEDVDLRLAASPSAGVESYDAVARQD